MIWEEKSDHRDAHLATGPDQKKPLEKPVNRLSIPFLDFMRAQSTSGQELLIAT